MDIFWGEHSCSSPPVYYQDDLRMPTLKVLSVNCGSVQGDLQWVDQHDFTVKAADRSSSVSKGCQCLKGSPPQRNPELV